MEEPEGQEAPKRLTRRQREQARRRQMREAGRRHGEWTLEQYGREYFVAMSERSHERRRAREALEKIPEPGEEIVNWSVRLRRDQVIAMRLVARELGCYPSQLFREAADAWLAEYRRLAREVLGG